jgi:hypothetical protein
MMRYVLSALFVAFITLLLGGCATKTNYEEALNINTLKAKYLDATEKGEILNALQTKVVATVTYLNKVEPKKYNEGENFIAGLYYPSIQNSAINEGLDSPHIELFMRVDGEKIEYTSAKEVKEDDSLLSQMPLYSKWYRYYFIKFEDVDAKEFDIVIKESSFGESVMEFKK